MREAVIGEGAEGLKTSHFTIRRMKYDRIIVKRDIRI